MAFQAGDVVTFAKLAWNVYQLGWADDSNATRHYADFGRDVRNLASSLDILSKVVSHHAQSSHASATLRWDPASLADIIGDYDQTLRECHSVLLENRRYEGAVGHVRTIRWNVLVMPIVDRLRGRVQLHNSKIMLVLKPFEIDLLSRIRQDVERMHSHLTSQIQSVHADLRRLIGVLVPDLDHELRLQTRRDIQLVPIPPSIDARFSRDTPTDSLPLRDMADAFVAHWERSTVGFAPGLLVETRTPPVDMWLALLKCVWLMARMRAVAETEPPASHWPSYIRQLEDQLSAQCRRVGSEVVPPAPMAVAMTASDLFDIWPKPPPPDLVGVVTQDEALELVLELPLRASPPTERSIKLYRRPPQNSRRRFRVVVTGIDRSVNPPLTQVETINFDIHSVRLNPLYAAPAPSIPEIVLQSDERIARIAFNDIRDLLKFQQGITGYQTWAGTVSYNAVANFVIANRQAIREKASIQIWRYKPLPTMDTTFPPSPAASVFSTAPVAIPRDTSPRGTLTGLPLSASPPRRAPTFPLPPTPSSTGFFGPRATVSTLSPLLPSPPTTRSMSISSGSSAACAPSIRSTSSNTSESYTVSVNLGQGSFGTLYKTPPHPLVVVFTQSPTTGRPAIVAIRIDQDTAVNSERCNCRQSGRAGADCPITALERDKGNDKIVARRFESANGEWPLADLASALADGSIWSRSSDDDWKNLVRVSFLFEGGPRDRAVFGGTPSECRCKPKRDGEMLACLRAGHGGEYGEVRELRRRQMLEYHDAMYEHKRHTVVHGRAERG